MSTGTHPNGRSTEPTEPTQAVEKEHEVLVSARHRNTIAKCLLASL